MSRTLLTEVANAVKWVLPKGADLKADFEEYKKKESSKWEARAKKIGARFPLFETQEDFEKALADGRIFTMGAEDWNNIHNLSQTSSIEELKDLVNSYARPRDVDRIVKGMEEGAELPLPIILKGSKGRWIMAGNTRLNVAQIKGITAKAVEVDVST